MRPSWTASTLAAISTSLRAAAGEGGVNHGDRIGASRALSQPLVLARGLRPSPRGWSIDQEPPYRCTAILIALSPRYRLSFVIRERVFIKGYWFPWMVLIAVSSLGYFYQAKVASTSLGALKNQ